MTKRRPPCPPVVLLLHVGWALGYDGDPGDLPQGKFGYIKAGNADMGEALNFKSYMGTCYGYAPHHKMSMSRLGAPGKADSVSGILVVWTATNPDGSGRFIVGWYRNATVFSSWRELRPSKRRPGIITKAAASGCQVIPRDERTFSIPFQRKGWPGTSSAFFASDVLTANEVELIVSYVGGAPSDGFLSAVNAKALGKGAGWPQKPDLEQNKKVEKAAEAAVTSHYRERGWKVRPVQDDWLGWDLTMTHGARELYVEVKGRRESGPVLLSANEHRSMSDRTLRLKYRLAIVFQALTSPKLTIFGYRPGTRQWASDEGAVLTFVPASMSATFQSSSARQQG